MKDLRIDRAGQRIGGEVVPAAVAHERDTAGERVEGPLHARADRAAGRRQACRRLGPGEVEEVEPFGIVEVEGAGDGVEHAVGRSVNVAALELGVVVRAHAGEIRHLLAPQPRHPSNIALPHIQARLLGRHPRPARHQKLTDLARKVAELLLGKVLQISGPADLFEHPVSLRSGCKSSAVSDSRRASLAYEG